MNSHLMNGDVMQIPLSDKSVHCIVTSPPYWGLRSYLTGDNKSLELGSEPLHDCGGWVTGDDCGECFVCHVRQYARELWRVLRDDGVWWLNLGDSYNANQGIGFKPDGGRNIAAPIGMKPPKVPGLKPKDLCGIPWRVALALQADGWYLRSDIIWAKPNPMPESVTDRPTKAHEYLFLLSKNKKYFYDADAVRESQSEGTFKRFGGNNAPRKPGVKQGGSARKTRQFDESTPVAILPSGRNRRTVWNIATAPYSGAHFATFPPKLVEPCIKAGTSEHGCCPECGKQWVRVVESKITAGGGGKPLKTYDSKSMLGSMNNKKSFIPGHKHVTTLGFRPDCDHGHDPIPCTVFDPFSGSGTTVLVANQLGRRGVGLDLSLDYIDLAKKRTGLTALAEWENGIDATAEVDLGPMFAEVDG